MVKAHACQVEGPRFKSHHGKFEKKKKKPAILCLHDGSPDDGSAFQLIKGGGGGDCHVYIIGAHKRTCVDCQNIPNHHTST